MQTPFTQEADFRQERDFGQKISAVFDFLRAHWRPLGRVLLYLVLPAALVQNILSVLVQRQMTGAMQAALQNQGGDLGGVVQAQRMMFSNVMSSPVYWVNSVLGTAFFALLILSIYGYVLALARRRTPGPEVTVAEVWATVKREFIGTYFSVWGVFLLIGAGMFVLLVPGIYLSVALSLFFIMKVAEGTGFFDTLGRCLRLTRGKWWSTFGLILVMILLLYVVLMGVGIAAALLSGGLKAIVTSSQEPSSLYPVVVASISSAMMLLLYPPLLLVLAFQYFNLVERKDGVGLHQLVSSLGQSAAPQARNASYQPDEEGEY